METNRLSKEWEWLMSVQGDVRITAPVTIDVTHKTLEECLNEWPEYESEMRKLFEGDPNDVIFNKYPKNNLRHLDYVEMQKAHRAGKVISRRNPMTQPTFTKSRKLNKGSQTNGWEQNRINYQKLHDRVCKCTEIALNLNDYEIMEYAVGNKFRKHHGLTWNHFDWASPAGKSFNPTNREERYHFMCWRDEVCTVVNAIKIK